MAESHENLLWDGIHLTPGGAGVYARLVSRVVHEHIAFPPPPPPPPTKSCWAQRRVRVWRCALPMRAMSP